MLARPAHLPNALVGLAPDVLEVGEKLDLGTHPHSLVDNPQRRA